MNVEVRDSVVRLTMAQLEALVAGEAPEEERSRVLDVPGMAEALDGVRDPLLLLQVDLVVAAGGRTHFGWVGADALALLLPVDDSVWQLMALPVDQVAASLARIVGLGPAAAGPREARALATNPFEQFFAADGAVRSAALADHQVDVAWTMGVRSRADEWLTAAASGPLGSWLYVPTAGVPAGDGPAMIAQPVSASDLYRRFTTIVPGILGA